MALMDGPGSVPDRSGARFRAHIERLNAIAKHGMSFGLEPMARVLAALGDPQRAFASVHVAGSNGKGSTSAFCAAILSSGPGRKVGLYTSPHLVALTERVQLVESMRFREIAEEAFADAFDAVERAQPGWAGLSFFEVLTAAGMVALRSEGIEHAVIEAGLGARLDATLLVDAHVGVLTDLALEHTEILGDTIEKIAREKCAVCRPGRPFVSAGGPPEALEVIEAAARAANAPLYLLGREIDARANPDGTFDLLLADRTLQGVELSLRGPHQGRNAILAAQAALLFDPALTDDAIRRGLASAVWPGRMEVFPNRRVVLDGAHNPQGTDALVRALNASVNRFTPPLHFVFGVLQDKDALRMIDAIAPLSASITLTRPDSARARDPSLLDRSLSTEVRAIAQIVEDPISAVQSALARAIDTHGWVVVCGSLYLVGSVRAWLTTSGECPTKG
jgi:dihydrofolate synthase/folylpolyglutamate synthase